MKKILLFILLIAFIGCDKETEPEITTADVFVNVYFKYDGSTDEMIAAPTMVQLYTQKVSDFDLEESYKSISDSYRMKLKNGEYVSPKYSSDSFSGINIFKDIEIGDYTVIAYYKPDGYSWNMFYYYAYKEISAIGLKQHNIVFSWNSEAGKFVKK